MSEPDALPLTNQEIDLDAAFESAIHHHQAGRLSQAEMLYQWSCSGCPIIRTPTIIWG